MNSGITIYSSLGLASETGYSYFGARYYDSELSVWLSVDPLDFKYPSQSPYSYVGNRPVNTIDPWGMDEVKDPNGKSNNAGDGYKATNDGKYLYGDGLKTKVWNEDLECGSVSDGQTKGGYEDYSGDAIDFDSYGKDNNSTQGKSVNKASLVLSIAQIAFNEIAVPIALAEPTPFGELLVAAVNVGFLISNYSSTLEMSRYKPKMQGGKQNQRDLGTKGSPKEFKNWLDPHSRKEDGAPDFTKKRNK